MNQNTDKIRYTLDLLTTVIQRDGAKLVGEYPKLNRDTIINFMCSCESLEQINKTFRCINTNGGAFCRTCTLKNTTEKLKSGNLEKYGVENQFQRPEIKDRMVETNIEKYGVKHPLQNKDILLKTQQTNLERYGCICPLRNDEILSRTKETYITKFGVNHPTQNKEVYDTIRKTNVSKYGVEFVTQSPIIKEKIQQTNLQKYGYNVCSKNKNVKEKMKDTCLRKYGVICPFQNEVIKQKAMETSRKRFGVDYPMQNLQIQHKQMINSYNYKKYKFSSGNIINVQGYEPFVLDILIKTYTEEQIKTARKDVPTIKYSFCDKEHYYFPDIYIPHENRIIEVKSKFTYSKELTKNILKKDATVKMGFSYEFWIMNPDGTLNEIIKF